MWFKMMRTDECGLDVGGFVFVFHVVEGRQNRLLQCLFVIGYKNVVNALLFLHKGSAPVFTLRVVEGVLHGLLLEIFKGSHQKSMIMNNTISCYFL